MIPITYIYRPAQPTLPSPSRPLIYDNMKQEESILKWASCVLSQGVANLKAVQQVGFVKRLLFRIDDVYFEEWQFGGGQESFSQVLERMGRYFREEIGTDISQHLQGLNVYRNVREVWELLLGIAIKGNNRNNNISLIFEMDHSIQADLVKIVTEIIDKFGQNTAAIEEELEEEPPTNDRQMMVELAQENEVLREECGRLQGELLRERQERASGTAARKQLQHSLQMMRLQKFAFLEVMANANRSNSKIFDDGENVLETQSNLSELAQDIVQFIRQQRKTLQAEGERASLLEDQVRELQEQVRRCVDENEVYLMKLADLNVYEREIQALREEVGQKEEWNLELIEQVSALEDEKANLLVNLQRRAVEVAAAGPLNGKSELEEVRPYEGEGERREKRLQRKETVRGDEARRSFQSSQGEKALGDSSYVPSQEKQAVRRQMQDQLREPQLRTKLQREVLFLKKTNNSLSRQMEALKRTNEALQRSAKSFLDQNQHVIGKWEHDYESIIAKMALLAKANDDLQHQNTQKVTQNQDLANRLKENEQKRMANQSRLFVDEEKSIDSRSNSEISSNEIQIKINAPESVSAEEKSKRDKAVLWDEIVLRLREIVREGKTKELAYESSLQGMRNENLKLLQLLRGRNVQAVNLPAAERNASEVEVRSQLTPYNYFLNIQRVESEEVRDHETRPVPPRLSYVDIQEGDELQQSAVSRLKLQKSYYYGVNSRIVNQMAERVPQPSFINDDSYHHFNRQLTSSIRESFKGLAQRVDHDPSASLELQRRMEEEVDRIGKQYQRLNSNYQNVFNKLHIYTETLREKQTVKEGYQQVLQEISKAEREVQASREAEIVQLRLFNQALRQQLTDSIIEKEEFAASIAQITTSLTAVRSSEQKKQQAAFREAERVLAEAGARFNASLKDPLAFLESCLQGSREEGQLQKYYRLYIRQRDRTKQLNEEIELLSSVLLEYRNMMC